MMWRIAADARDMMGSNSWNNLECNGIITEWGMVDIQWWKKCGPWKKCRPHLFWLVITAVAIFLKIIKNDEMALKGGDLGRLQNGLVADSSLENMMQPSKYAKY